LYLSKKAIWEQYTIPGKSQGKFQEKVAVLFSLAETAKLGMVIR
jgi:hypothetical protein